MTDLQVFDYESQEVRTVLKNNEVWFVARDVLNVLNIKDTTTAINQIDNDEKLTQFLIISGQGRNVWTINESGLYRLVSKSHKPEAKKFRSNIRQIFGDILKLDWDNMYMFTSKEQDCLETIINSIKDLFAYELQYSVLNKYQIDLYFPSLGLAIECDKNGHKGYLREADEERQKEIETELGCKFIRFNPDLIDFNIGSVINQILKRGQK